MAALYKYRLTESSGEPEAAAPSSTSDCDDILSPLSCLLIFCCCCSAIAVLLLFCYCCSAASSSDGVSTKSAVFITSA